MGAFAQAAETAKARLTANRDVHSLHEVAALHCKYADSIRALDWPLAVKTLKYAVRLLREAKELNPRFLPVRLQLPIALEALTAYAQCSDEIGTTNDPPLHVSDRVVLAYLIARCLDGVGAHERCWEFCDGWLRWIAEVAATNPVPRHNGVRLERVRAVTIADGYCIGKMKDGQHVIAPVAAEFFAPSYATRSCGRWTTSAISHACMNGWRNTKRLTPCSRKPNHSSQNSGKSP